MLSEMIGPAARAYCGFLLAAGCAVGLATMTPAAQANVVKADWLLPNFYSYEIRHMPDFDQRRAATGGIAGGIPGLPNNGSVHCVPTSAINLMAYAANHGFPNIQPGNEPWWAFTNPERYDTITNNIDIMGTIMGTGLPNGTGGAGEYIGVYAWLLAYAPGQFTITQQWASGTWSPTIATAAKASIFGGITNICYGRYTQIGTVFGFPLVDRGGGHCVTLVKANQTGTSIQFEIRDPADDTDGNLFTQSPFVNRQWGGTNQLFFVRQNGVNYSRTMTRLTGNDLTALRMIDSYISIRPKAAYSFTTTQIPPTFNYHIPAKFAGSNAGSMPSVALGSMTAFQSAAQLPDLSKFAVSGLIDGAPGIAMFDPFSQTFDPFYFGSGIKGLAFGRNRLLYAIAGGDVQCFDIDATNITPTEIPWPFPPEGIAYDDLNDEIVTIGRFGINFAVKKANCPTCPVEPLLISVSGLGERPSVVASPEDGTYWIWSSAGPLLYQMRRQGNELELDLVAQVPGCQPTSVHVGDNGSLFVVCDGSVKELRLVEMPSGGFQWQLFEDSIFKDLQGVGAGFAVELSRSNFDPAQHDIPGWNNNILPEELGFPIGLPDCLGDLNGDRIVNADDLGILLGAFGNSSLGDINVDQVTDADDLGILLGVFGQPCPDPI